MSPSTDSSIPRAARTQHAHRTSGAAAASVRTTDSIVAMFGWIIPTPFAIPVTVTVTGSPSAAGSTSDVVAALRTESVVRRASAAASSPASSPLSAEYRLPTPASTRSSGSRVPMMPVDRWRTRCSSMPHAPATSRPTASWSVSPAAPVAAFAQPLVEMTAEAKPKPPRWSSDVAARLARDRFTGAAANAFGVNTAAAAADHPSPRSARGPGGPTP